MSLRFLEPQYVPLYHNFGFRTFGGYGGPSYGGLSNRFGLPGAAGSFDSSAASVSASSQSFYSGGLSMPSYSSMPNTRVLESRFEENDEELRSTFSAPMPPSKPKVVEIRKTFPETWLFDSFDFDET